MSEVLLKENKEERLIDLSSTDLSENFLYELTNLVESESLQGNPIKVNLGEVEFSKENLENIISVLKGFGIEIEMVYAEVLETKIAAMNLGLTVSGQKLEIEIPEEEQAEEVSGSSEEILENILGEEEISESEKKDTLYIKQTLRSGQKIEFDGNVMIVGDCNAGSEIVASGDITVWGILNGIAHAGSAGDNKACIRAFRINAIQLRIGENLARKPDMMELDKMDRTSLFKPEEARVSDGEIVIYSINQEFNY